MVEEDAVGLPHKWLPGACMSLSRGTQGTRCTMALRIQATRLSTDNTPEQVTAYKSARGFKPALIIRLFPHIKMLSKNIVSQDSCQQEGS